MQGWPKTIDEAVDSIVSRMDEESKRSLRMMREQDLIQYHFGWGMAIRCDFGLWCGNAGLLEDAGTDEPDEASMAIIAAVWKRLRHDSPAQLQEKPLAQHPAPEPL